MSLSHTHHHQQAALLRAQAALLRVMAAMLLLIGASNFPRINLENRRLPRLLS